jgi:MFS family permease
MFMAILSALMAANRSIASFASGFIADNWGYSRNFLIAAAILVAAGLLVIIGIRKIPLKATIRKPSDTQTDPTALQKPKIPYRIFIPQCVVVALYWLGIGILTAFLPLFSYQVIGLSVTQIGINATVGAVVSAALVIPFGRLADLRDKKTLMGIGLLIFSLSFIGLMFPRSYALLIVFIISYNAGSAMFTPSSLAFLSLNVPSQRQSFAMGVYGAAEDIGFIIGSSIGGLFWNFWGPSSTFITGFAAGIVGVVFCFNFIKENKSRRELSY